MRHLTKQEQGEIVSTSNNVVSAHFADNLNDEVCVLTIEHDNVSLCKDVNKTAVHAVDTDHTGQATRPVGHR